jgi:hypothetical protein
LILVGDRTGEQKPGFDFAQPAVFYENLALQSKDEVKTGFFDLNT